MNRSASMIALAALLTFGVGAATVFAGEPAPAETKDKKDQMGGKADDQHKDKKDMGGGKADDQKDKKEMGGR